MRRAGLFWIVLALLGTLLSACGGPPVPLVGTIKDAYTGAPITGAQVALGEAQLTTSAEGRFEAGSWSAEDTLQVTAPGYEPLTIALAERPELQSPTPPAATLDAQLRPNTLRGVIKDAYSGQPLGGVSVVVGEGMQATTAADGSYSIAGVPERFAVQLAAPGYEATTLDVAQATAQDATLRPNVLRGTLTDEYSGQPVAGAKVGFGTAAALTGDDGAFVLEGAPEAGTLTVAAEGYEQLTTDLSKATSFEGTLRPDRVGGVVTNAATGEPVANFTVVVGERLDAPGSGLLKVAQSDDGSFTLDGVPQNGFVQVLAPGYKKAVAPIKDGQVATAFALEPFQTKALYVTAAIGAAGLLDEYLDLIDNSELNTLIIDLKSDMRDDLGLLYYDSQVPLAQELDLAAPAIDFSEILAECKERGIYTIARIQLFAHDNALADARPEWTIRDRTTGQPYSDLPGPGIRYTWLDPTNRNVWQYNIDLGIEAALMGFDEINYDYVRFPDNAPADYADFIFSEPVDPVNNQEAMYEVIAGFAEEAHKAVNNAGAYVSLDVFGRAVLAPARPVSQDIERLAEHADYVMPMVYPSLWWGGAFGLDVPVAQPYETIKGSVEAAIPQFEGRYAVQRPWLQDHTDPWAPVVIKYGPAEVRAQIDAVSDVDPQMGWALYNSANVYTDAALRPE